MEISASQKKLCFAAHPAKEQQCCFPTGTRDTLQDQCINSGMFMSADPTEKQTESQKTTTTICHSTAKHQFIEDLFAASHHSCSPGWPLGRPLVKECEPSCSFVLLGHVWQNRSKDSNFYLLITCSLFPDPEGEKNLSLINVVLTRTFQTREMKQNYQLQVVIPNPLVEKSSISALPAALRGRSLSNHTENSSSESYCTVLEMGCSC